MRPSDNENKPSFSTLILIFLIVFIAGKFFTSNNTAKSPVDFTPATTISNTYLDQNLTKLNLPDNGTTSYFINSEAIAPLGINTKEGQNYFIKLVDSDTNKTALTIFVRGGQPVNIQIPLGNYELRYANGIDWYGEDHLFGSNTSYSKSENILSFYRNGPQIMGHTIMLYNQINGNMPTKDIEKSEF